MESTNTITETSNNTMTNPEPYKKTGLGERLKTARKAMRLSEKEAAARLHLNIQIISLLEDENFVEGPPATFMRGYLRTYARLLNLSEDEIAITLKELENAIPSSVTAAPAIQVKAPIDNERYLRWLTYVIVLVLLILVSTWWSSHSRYVIADVPPPAPPPEAKSVTETAISANPTTLPPVATTQPTAPQQTITPAAVSPSTATTPAATPIVAGTTPTTAPLATPTTPTTVATTPQNIAATTTSPEAAPVTPSKPSTLSELKMAVPEPDIDN